FLKNKDYFQSDHSSCFSSQLESLITDAFKGKGFQKINELFEEKEIYPPQKYSKQLFNQLDKVLKKELDKNEFQNVSLLLKCIQMYFKSDPQEGASLLIQQGLIPKISIIFTFTRCKTLTVLLGKKQLLDSFLPDLGQLVTETKVGCALRQEALRTLNSMLDSVPREERRKFPMSEEMCSLTKDLAKTILEVGDYDLQVALSEALCRLITKKWRDDLVHNWFEDDYLAEAFKEIKDREFETYCIFVWALLEIMAMAVLFLKVKKPSDEKLEEFWIDFNVGSQSVSFYIDSAEGALWDSVRLPREVVSSYSLREEIVKIYMKNPTMINGKEVTKIKIHFSAKFDILNTLNEVLGKDKMMASISFRLYCIILYSHKTFLTSYNRDTASNSHSEKSWILDSQKKSLPKTLDYTRRRPRVRSKLKGKDYVMYIFKKSADVGLERKHLLLLLFSFFLTKPAKYIKQLAAVICCLVTLHFKDVEFIFIAYRLNKLENFHKVVVQELANLEKDAQILSILEKDTVDFWNKQSIKLSSFCNHQKQRYLSSSCLLNVSF
uniref:Synaptonemal complex protein 2 like n=1 Tax=Chrysemys picta bellii TaxID=8478 RepID=A0A8C3FMS2_CHRPI